MAGSLGQRDFAPPIRMYRAYFSRPKTDPFGGDYAAVLDPYQVDSLNSAAAPTPASVAQHIYAAGIGAAAALSRSTWYGSKTAA